MFLKVKYAILFTTVPLVPNMMPSIQQVFSKYLKNEK